MLSDAGIIPPSSSIRLSAAVAAAAAAVAVDPHDQNANPINPNSNPSKRKRSLPGTPDPEAEVVALSPRSLMATNRFICEICNKGFQRDQNLQLHRRGHNLPWKLKQRSNKEVKKKVYICPEKSCVHHDPARALGDLTGIKKHFSRKHGEKKWKCDKCSKKYAVQSDWKAHSKICGTREYKCDCGTLFSRKDSFITHRAFCDALAEESARFPASAASAVANLSFKNEMMSGGVGMGSPQFPAMFRQEIGGLDSGSHQLNLDLQKPRLPIWLDSIGNQGSSSSGVNFLSQNPASLPEFIQMNQWFSGDATAAIFPCADGGSINIASSSSSLPRILKEEEESNKASSFSDAITSIYFQPESHAPPPMSATALLQKAAQMGSTRSTNSVLFGSGFGHMTSSFSNGCFNDAAAAAANRAMELESHHHHRHGMGKSETLQSLMAAPSSSSPSDFLRSQGGIEAEAGLTRDFLGVGGNDRKHHHHHQQQQQQHEFLQENELAKFASVGSLEMTHFRTGQ